MAEENAATEKDLAELKSKLNKGEVGRREFLRRAFGLGLSAAACYSLLGTASASGQQVTLMVGEGQQPTTLMLGGGEESTLPPAPPQPSPPRITTAMGQGEENQFPPPSPPVMTTQAIGEEGTPTTLAFGEEGTVIPTPPPAPPATTLAWGEEGGVVQPSTRAWGEEGGVVNPPPATSAMVGEEGGGVQICPQTGLPIQQQIPWNGFPRW